jgi:hypothetical protein
MSDHIHTLRSMSEMVRMCTSFPDDEEAIEIIARASFEAEETATYTHEDEPSLRGWRVAEAIAAQAFAEEMERAAREAKDVARDEHIEERGPGGAGDAAPRDNEIGAEDR